MDPLNGRAEQISARIAAVISMNTIVMRNEDLRTVRISSAFTKLDCYHIAAGPPASNPKKIVDLTQKIMKITQTSLS